MIDVTVLMLDDGHASTSIGPLEVFSDAGSLWNIFIGREPRPLFRVRSASVRGGVLSPHGPLKLIADAAIADIDRTDLVFVPSTGLALDAFLEANQPIIEWLREQRKKGAKIAGVCAGVALLGEAGFLDGRRATTHWALVEDYKRRYPKAQWQPDIMVTEQDGIFCGAGVHASNDLALYLVEKLAGHFHALQTAKSLIIDMPRTSQKGFAIMPLSRAHTDVAIRRAEDIIQDRYDQAINMENVAGELGMSPRNFVRRFKEATGETPLTYQQKLRVATARQILEEDFKTVQEVSRMVGYTDAAFFRDVFRRHTGTSPAKYRERFARDVSAA